MNYILCGSIPEHPSLPAAIVPASIQDLLPGLMNHVKA